MNSEEYFNKIQEGVDGLYTIAREARAKGLDPSRDVEIKLATTLGAKAVGLISTIYPQMDKVEIIDRILELEREYGQLAPEVSFKIAEEVAKQKFCEYKNQLEAIDAGIRLGFAYNTLGVVSSPIEGYTTLKTNKNEDGGEYFVPYFSGPIRSAGTTASCMVLILIDFLRESFGYAKYKPTEKEIKRVVTELYDYHERVNNLQYLPTEEEAEFLGRNMPIQVSGEPTEKREVSNFKDLERIETNFIRGGFCLIMGEGLAQKAQKGLRILRKLQTSGFKISDWEFLEEYVALHKKRDEGKKLDSSPTYMKDLVAGRPIFGHPSRSGSFRFRYGRSRSGGFSATSIHPATMAISGGFIATGTQVKVEKPTKGCITTVCDTIDGPIVKMKNGDLKKVRSAEEAKSLYKDVEEIVYFGDILFSFGDVLNRNSQLLKAGYVEEWWELELKKASGETKMDGLQFPRTIKLEEAIKISEKYNIPLHPEYIYYWTQIDYNALCSLLYWLENSRLQGKIILPYNKEEKEQFKEGKRALELLGVPHEVAVENVVLREEESKALLFNLGILPDVFLNENYKLREDIAQLKLKINTSMTVLEIINKLSFVTIKDKAGTFIGSRMGRPEKAKLRKLVGSPSVLFPVGEEGGRFRSVNEAGEKGTIKGDFPIHYCKECQRDTIYPTCEICKNETEKRYYCIDCKEIIQGKECTKEEHKRVVSHSNRRIDSKHYIQSAAKTLGIPVRDLPPLIKGVRGTSNKEHVIENLSKGILRAKHGLCVNKDGTIRYDAIEIPITHFKPKEIGTTKEKLLELGYNQDVNGQELTNDEQVLELKPHDIILPSCPEAKDEKSADVFFSVTKFLDETLEKMYKLPKFYNLTKKEELVGHLVTCMSPHNCAGVVGRIIGFSKTQGLLASPYIHAAMRRDCDGDEAAVMMLLDVLLNFSRGFLPAHRGGTQDAPLVLNSRLRAGEVDDQILDLELVNEHPLTLYELSEKGSHSSEIKIRTVREALKKGEDPFTNIGYTHATDNINAGVTNSSYKFLPTMHDKVEKQMELDTKLRSVDESDVARLIIERHFIRDIRGNLRKFSQQSFRCVGCNEIHRRPPMSGKCVKCEGKIIFTISYGSIIKYLEPAITLATTYNVSPYLKQSLLLARSYIESIFGKEKHKQVELKKWF
ncbi:MAG: DNA polymerase II large subunit [Nanoarchaeota archaeon]